MSRIIVQPGGADRRVPVENLKGVYFEQEKAVEVRNTDYIRRRIADGDLVEAKAVTAAAPVAKPDLAPDTGTLPAAPLSSAKPPAAPAAPEPVTKGAA